jgi:hypothetical protein
MAGPPSQVKKISERGAPKDAILRLPSPRGGLAHSDAFPSHREAAVSCPDRAPGVLLSCLGFEAVFGVQRTRRTAAHRRYRAGAHQASSGSIRCGRTLLISAAAEDICHGDHRAEKEGSFHIIVGLLSGSGPGLAFHLPPINEPAKKQAVIPHFPAPRSEDAGIRPNYSAFNCRIIRPTSR